MKTQDYKPGMRAHVTPGGQLDHDFDGEVTRNDPDNGLVFVREDETEEVWGMPTNFVTLLATPEERHSPEQVIAAIEETLWPKGDEERSWSPDTLDAISEILTSNGYGPK